MKVKVKTPEGGWLYVKRNADGKLVLGIYPTDALEGETELAACQAEYPALEFRLVEKV